VINHLKKKWRSWIVAIACIVVAILIVWFSDAFHQCMKQSYYESADYEPEKGIAQIFATLGWTKTCTGAFLKENGEAITAFFTLVVGLFTAALWSSTERLWQSSERDFISSNRPKLIIREVQRLPPSQTRQNVELRYVIANIGGSDAQIVESHVEVQEIRDGNLRPLQPFEGANPIGRRAIAPGAHIFDEFGSTVSIMSLVVSRMADARRPARPS
jgi:hypothetical protein